MVGAVIVVDATGKMLTTATYPMFSISLSTEEAKKVILAILSHCVEIIATERGNSRKVKLL